VVVFTAQNGTQKEQFEEYISYFASKERAGIICTLKGYIYLLPPSPFASKFFQGKMAHMVGLIIDQQQCKDAITDNVEEAS
jgi:hypothetical protein